MADISLIEKYLPKELWDIAQKYDIPSLFLEKDAELIVMILQSRSIDTEEEKQNRFNLLPLMNDEQIEKLRWILVKEKQKLKEIEEKYEKKKQEIKQKYLNKREDAWYAKKVDSMKQKEQQVAQKDAEAADDLLDMI